MELTQEYLKSILEYRDGELYWTFDRHSVKKGDLAGHLCKFQSGIRRTIMINKRNYYISRLIFFYHHGYFPKIVDHIDRNTLNNRIENLREATPSESDKNRKSFKNSSSQYKGVWFIIKRKKIKEKTYEYSYWESSIQSNGKNKHLGLFKTEIEAAISYNEAAKKIHGEFAFLNVIEYEF